MNRALDAANQKLSRATEHLQTLTTEMTTFRERNPYAVTVDFESHTGWWVAKARIKEEPPPLLSILLGEIAYACLSALNHLVWELAARKVGRNKVFMVKLSVQFPVTSDPSHWNRTTLVRKHLVSKKALTLIEGLQPYNGPHGQRGATTHPLSLIKEIADADKHRVLAAAFAQVRLRGLTWTWDEARASGPTYDFLARTNRMLKDGSPVARIRFHERNRRSQRERGRRACPGNTLQHRELVYSPRRPFALHHLGATSGANARPAVPAQVTRSNRRMA